MSDHNEYSYSGVNDESISETLSELKEVQTKFEDKTNYDLSEGQSRTFNFNGEVSSVEIDFKDFDDGGNKGSEDIVKIIC